MKRARPAPGRKNDVYADRSGAVACPEGDRWEVRDRGQWTRDAVAEKRPDGASDRVGDVRDRTTPEQRARVADRGSERMPQRPSSVQRPSRPARPEPTRIDRHELDRARRARQIGTQREMSRPSRPVRRPAGGLRAR